MRPTPESGFTLMEALVALAILAIAAAGLVRATQSHIDSVRGLQQRAAARWIAENRMAELHVGAAGARSGDRAEMLGEAYTITTTTQPTDDPDLLAVRISVTPATGVRPIASLDGFMDVGSVR